MANALADAVRKNDVPVVVQLIEKGANVNDFDEYGMTALICAASEGFVGCAKLLLEANADVDKGARYRWIPLHNASNNGHAECVKVRYVSFCG